MSNFENREIELRAYDIDTEALRETLQNLGATALGTKEMQRAVFDVQPANPNKWIRLRNEGDKTTLAIKERISDTVDGTGEVEMVLRFPLIAGLALKTWLKLKERAKKKFAPLPRNWVFPPIN